MFNVLFCVSIKKLLALLSEIDLFISLSIQCLLNPIFREDVLIKLDAIGKEGRVDGDNCQHIVE